MDDLDRALIAQLQADARQSLSVLSRKLGLARSTVQSRLERLEASGAIAGYTVRLGEAAQRPAIRASVLLAIEPRNQAAILSRLRAMPEIERAFTTSGRFDLLLQVAAETTPALDALLDAIGCMPGVRSSESLIHLTTRIDRKT
ncbi:Lrp/AsnC family transcriptional regulator [Pararhodobacter sp.]